MKSYRPKRCFPPMPMAPRPPRIMFLARPPLPICLKTFAICAYWRRRLFTSCTSVPLPLAMRLRREPLIISWLRRSRGVIELMIASRRTNCFSSTEPAACWSPANGPTDGSILRMLSIEPIFLIWRNWSRKSSSVKPSPSRAFLANSSLFLRSSVDSADDAVGMEGLECVGLFADADELDGLAGDVADRKRCATAGIAIHFGEHYAGETETLVKVFSRVDGVLAGHGVGNEQNLRGIEQLLQPL